MIISSLSEINDIKFEKVKNEYRYMKSLCNALADFVGVLRNNKEIFAQLQAKDSGKPVKYCRIEVERCDDQLNQAISYIQYKYFVESTGIMRSIKHLPIGKVLAITTFSSPYSSFFS